MSGVSPLSGVSQVLDILTVEPACPLSSSGLTRTETIKFP